MLNRFKNLKIVKQLRESVSPKLRWLSFSNKNSLDKSTVDYLEAISGVNPLGEFSDLNDLDMMVRNQLKEEFPGIENKKSYELLVDAVKNNIMKKQISATDDLDIE